MKMNLRGRIETKLGDVKTKGLCVLLGEVESTKPTKRLSGIRYREGVSLIQGLMLNHGKRLDDVKRKAQANSEAESIEGSRRDGQARSSVERLVMSLERRGLITQLCYANQPQECGRSSVA